MIKTKKGLNQFKLGIPW